LDNNGIDELVFIVSKPRPDTMLEYYLKISSCNGSVMAPDVLGVDYLDIGSLVTGAYYHFNLLVDDYDQNGGADIIISRGGNTTFFTAKYGTYNTSTNTTNQAPIITNIIPSVTPPVTRFQPMFYYYTATDNESDPLYGSIKCDIYFDAPSDFSTANTFNTIHSPCTFWYLGQVTSRIWVTDNQGLRQFIIFNYSNSAYYRDYNITVKYACGDIQCDVNEDYLSCPADCPLTTCGDTVCQLTESIITCPIDCYVSTCNNTICELTETYSSCPVDCNISTCGNGIPDAGENSSNCPYDVFTLGACGDGYCGSGETYSSCPADCTTITCGNGVCNSGETYSSCPADCSSCGNGICESQESNPSSSLYCINDCPSRDMEIPAQLVDPEHPDQGLLPELYFGIKAFFAPIIIPIVAVMICVMVAMVFITIGSIIKSHIDKK
jgi:hypothetical protein